MSTLYVFENAAQAAQAKQNDSTKYTDANTFSSLAEAVANASASEATTIELAAGTYADNLYFRTKTLDYDTTKGVGSVTPIEQKADITIKAAVGAAVKITGQWVLGERVQNTTYVDAWNATLTVEGVTFDSTELDKAGNESGNLFTPNIKQLNVNNCIFTGPGWGLNSRGSSPSVLNFTGCTIENSFGPNNIISFSGCHFFDCKDSNGNIIGSASVNIQTGKDVVFEKCDFDVTITDPEYYLVRNNGGVPVVFRGGSISVDIAKDIDLVTDSIKHGAVLVQRSSSETSGAWIIDGVEINISQDALDAGLLLRKNNSNGTLDVINMTSTSNNVDQLLTHTSGKVDAKEVDSNGETISAATYLNGELKSKEVSILYLNGEKYTGDMDYKTIKAASGTSTITDADINTNGLMVGNYEINDAPADTNVSDSAKLTLSGVTANVTGSEGKNSGLWVGKDTGVENKGKYQLILKNGTVITANGASVRNDGYLEISEGSMVNAQVMPVEGEVKITGKDSVLDLESSNTFGDNAVVTIENGGKLEATDGAVLTNNGELSINGGIIDAGTVKGSGSITVNKGNVVKGKATASTLNIDNLQSNIVVNDNVTITGSVKSNVTDTFFIVGKNVTFSGFKLNEGVTSYNKSQVEVHAGASLNVTNGTVIGASNLFDISGGKATISADSSVTTSNFQVWDIAGKPSTVTIDGTVNATVFMLTTQNEKSSSLTVNAGATVNVGIGQFKLQTGTMTVYGYFNGNCTRGGGSYSWVGSGKAHPGYLTIDGTYAAADNNNGKFVNTGNQYFRAKTGTITLQNNALFDWKEKVILEQNSILTVKSGSTFQTGGEFGHDGKVTVDNATFIAQKVNNAGTFTVKGTTTLYISDFSENAISVSSNAILTGDMNVAISVSGTASLAADTVFSGKITKGSLKVAASNTLTIKTGSSAATLLAAAGEYSDDKFGDITIKGATKNAELTLKADSLNGNKITNAQVKITDAAADEDVDIKADIKLSDIKTVNGNAVVNVNGIYFYNENDNTFVLNKVNGGIDIVKAEAGNPDTDFFQKEVGNLSITGDLSKFDITMKDGKTTLKVANGDSASIGTVSKSNQGGVNNVSVGKGSSLTVDTIERMGNITVGKNDSAMKVNKALTGTSAAEKITVGKGSNFESKDIDFSTGKATFKLDKQATARIYGEYVVDGSSNTIKLGANAILDIKEGSIINRCGDNYDEATGIVKYAPTNGSSITLARGAKMTSSNVIGLEGLTLANSAKSDAENSTAFDSGMIAGTEKRNVISVGNYCTFSADSIDMYNGNDVIKTGKGSVVDLGAVDFGDGKDTLTIGRNSVVQVSSIEGLETLNASKGSSIWFNNGAEDADFDGIAGSWKNATIYDDMGDIFGGDDGSGAVYGNEWDIYDIDSALKRVIIDEESNSDTIYRVYEKGVWDKAVGEITDITSEYIKLESGKEYVLAVSVEGADFKNKEDAANMYSFTLLA